MDENEFKKLASNSRDWEIYQLLSEKSKKLFTSKLTENEEKSLRKLEQKFEDDPEMTPLGPKGKTTIEETVTGKIVLVTDLAVLLGNADRVAWFPKSVILNLDKIALKQGETVELKIKDWFKYKIEWKVPQE